MKNTLLSKKWNKNRFLFEYTYKILEKEDNLKCPKCLDGYFILYSSVPIILDRRRRKRKPLIVNVAEQLCDVCHYSYDEELRKVIRKIFS